jgi:hypothetical protein
MFRPMVGSVRRLLKAPAKPKEAIMFGGLVTIAGGLIASSNFIVSKAPNSRDLLDKLTPYTGWIGTLMFFWGVWETISVVTHLSLLGEAPLQWIFWLCVGLADLIVGFLLGFGLISKYALSRNAAALAKGQTIRAKLVPYQTLAGVFAVVMGALYIVWLFM